VPSFRLRRPREFPKISDAGERLERVIATGRVFLAVGSLVGLSFGPIPPTVYAVLIHRLLLTYLVFSVLVWIVVKFRPATAPAFAFGTHAADILFAVGLTLFSRGPDSPFFIFFVFILLAAAYRWGFRGTLLTLLAGVALLVGEAYLLTPATDLAAALGKEGFLVEGQFEMGRLVLRTLYLVLVGVLLGYLAEGEKSLQAESAAVAQIVNQTQLGLGLRATLEGMFGEVLRFFRASRALVVIEELASGRLLLWEARRPVGGRRVELRLRELDRGARGTYLPETDAVSWLAQRRWPGNFYVLARDGEDHRLRRPSSAPAKALEGVARFDGVMAASFRVGNDWQGRLYLLDPELRMGWGEELRFLRRIVEQAAPAAYNAYLLTRLRSQVSAAERRRMAHELHDGAIQSLVAAEMQMDVLRRQAGRGAPDEPGPLARVQSLIHEQVLKLRELMEEIKPVNPDPRRLSESLAERVEKFQRETGIETTFAYEEPVDRLTGRVCRELIYILQEALFNIRRHSGARRVDICLSRVDGTPMLAIADDGRGFDFAGRWDQATLEAARKGPQVIQERLRGIGGQLVVESYPGKGARLEIFLPPREP
jgi:signal transduction histidine kinase